MHFFSYKDIIQKHPWILSFYGNNASETRTHIGILYLAIRSDKYDFFIACKKPLDIHVREYSIFILEFCLLSKIY